MLKAVIIDDILQARAALRADLEECCPEILIIGEAEGVESGYTLIRKENPDVVFLDIKMNDGTGFDLLERLKEKPPRVIFTTAFDDMALRAFRYAAVDYLLKPVDTEELKKAVSKLSVEKVFPDSYRFLLENFKNLGTPAHRKIALNTQEKVRVVSIPDIMRCESSSNYTTFYLQGGEKIVVTKTMKEYEEILEPHQFFRVHHSHLVNLNHVKEFIKSDGGYLVMNHGESVPVSTRKREEVLKRLQEM